MEKDVEKDGCDRGPGVCVDPRSTLDKLKESRSELLTGIAELDALIGKVEKDPSLMETLKVLRRYTRFI